MKKINSEFKINCENNFIVTMGTSDKKNPEVIYSTLSTYITPISTEINESIFEAITKDVKKYLKTLISNNGLCEKDIIVINDVAVSRMVCGKQTYFDMQIYFKLQKNTLKEYNKNFKNLSDILFQTYVKDIVKNIEFTLSSNDFNVTVIKNKNNYKTA
jgi:hypothetical protein